MLRKMISPRGYTHLVKPHWIFITC